MVAPGELAGIEALRILAGWLFIVSAIGSSARAVTRKTVMGLGSKRTTGDALQPGFGEP